MKDEAAVTPTSHYHSHPYGQYPGSAGPVRQHRVPIVIVGNKKDLYHAREVSTDDGKLLAARTGCDFFETSAKSNSNVESAFKSLVRQIKIAKGGGEKGSGGGVGTVQRKKRKKCVIL